MLLVQGTETTEAPGRQPAHLGLTGGFAVQGEPNDPWV